VAHYFYFTNSLFLFYVCSSDSLPFFHDDAPPKLHCWFSVIDENYMEYLQNNQLGLIIHPQSKEQVQGIPFIENNEETRRMEAYRN
jgi:hypothetical protein